MAALHSPPPWRWLLVDVFCASTVVTFLALSESGVISGTKTGFYCDDPAIGFRFHGDTVSLTTLLATTAFVPLIAVWLVESWGRAAEFPGPEPPKRRSELGARLASVWYREFLLGLGFVLLVTNFAKLLVGEPRPHFLHTCRPDAARNCTPDLGYIVDFNCTSTDFSDWIIRDSTKSFPSGHASISVYSALFLVWFLQKRLVNTSWLLVPWLQSVCMLWALVCSLTRITDRRHHWWDVLAGAVVGVAAAAFTVSVFCRGFIDVPVLLRNDVLTKDVVAHENGHMGSAFRSTRHQSVRRLLSSTSSCAGDTATDEQEMKEAA